MGVSNPYTFKLDQNYNVNAVLEEEFIITGNIIINPGKKIYNGLTMVGFLREDKLNQILEPFGSIISYDGLESYLDGVTVNYDNSEYTFMMHMRKKCSVLVIINNNQIELSCSLSSGGYSGSISSDIAKEIFDLFNTGKQITIFIGVKG